MNQENEYPFIKNHKELNNEPGKDDGSDGNDEVPNKLIKTVNAINSVGCMYRAAIEENV